MFENRYLSPCLKHLVVWILVFSPLRFLSGQIPEQRHFLVLKLGDQAATPEMASEYLSTIADYFTSRVPGLADKNLRTWITNRPDSATAILSRLRHVFAFVPAGFYIEYLYRADGKVTPIVQTPRFGKAVEKYYLVTTESGPNDLTGLKGKIVRVPFGVDSNYLRRVVFPTDLQPGTHFTLEPSTNLADEMFLMIEAKNAELGVSEKQAPSALLLDEELKNFFATDDLTWEEVKIIWSSQDLPRELFITIGDQWSEVEKKELFEALVNMKNDRQGTELLELMHSSGFTEVDTSLLQQTIQKYLSRKRGL